MTGGSGQKLGAFIRRATVDMRGLTETAAKALLVKVATEGNARILAEQTARSGGIKPGFTQRVDGVEGRALERVAMPGIIRFDYDYRWEAALWLIAWLEANSPEESGDYRRGHVALVDGSAVPATGSRQLAPAAELFVTNGRPYSRRLEVGKSRDGTPFVVDVEPMIYQRGVKAARSAFSGLVTAGALRINSTYVALSGGYTTRGGQAMRYPAAQFIRP